MSDAWRDRLSEYLDGELGAAEAQALESHLEECEDCRQSLAELRSVVTRLGADPVTASDQPNEREWAAIRRSLSPPRRRWIVPTALAASLAALALVGSLLWRRAPDSPDTGAAAVALPADYREASRDLEAMLRENQGRLRPETVRALEASMAQIDSAIAQARRALAGDPASEYLSRYVRQLHETRLMTLRQAVAVVRQRS